MVVTPPAVTMTRFQASPVKALCCKRKMEVGLLGMMSGLRSSTQLIAGGFVGAILGISITVWRGLRDKLELVLQYQLGPDIDLQTTTEMGAWIAIAGYSLALAGALIAWVDRISTQHTQNSA